MTPDHGVAQGNGFVVCHRSKMLQERSPKTTRYRPGCSAERPAPPRHPLPKPPRRGRGLEPSRCPVSPPPHLVRLRDVLTRQSGTHPRPCDLELGLAVIEAGAVPNIEVIRRKTMPSRIIAPKEKRMCSAPTFMVANRQSARKPLPAIGICRGQTSTRNSDHYSCRGA